MRSLHRKMAPNSPTSRPAGQRNGHEQSSHIPARRGAAATCEHSSGFLQWGFPASRHGRRPVEWTWGRVRSRNGAGESPCIKDEYRILPRTPRSARSGEAEAAGAYGATPAIIRRLGEENEKFMEKNERR